MKITFLGTGTSQGVPVIGCNCATCKSSDQRDTRLRCALHIDHKGHNIVIDVGPDFRQQLLNNKITNVDTIFITHEHADHTAGIDDIRPINFMTRQPMEVYAMPRVAEDLKNRFAYIFKDNPYPGAPKVNLHAVEEDFKYKDLNIEVIHYAHGSLPMQGYKINSMAYLTDFFSIEDDEKEKLRGIDTLIISALRREPHYSHLTLNQAIEFIKEVGAKRAYLIHMSHSLGPVATWEHELPPHISPAFDGLTVQI